MNYTVKQGDCMSSIAVENGFFWQTLWNLSENAALKTKRKNPNVLLAGDKVFIPDLRVKNESRASGTKYTFVRKGVPEKLRMKLVDANHKPRANLDYIIVIDGNSQRGTTNSAGEITQSIPPGAKVGKLIIQPPTPPQTGKGAPPPKKPRREITKLQLGHLDPISEVTGLKSRLANLKFYRGPIDGNVDDATKQALSNFQKRKGLPVTGVADDATKSLLQKLHGH